jgi:hypothetical protein
MRDCADRAVSDVHFEIGYEICGTKENAVDNGTIVTETVVRELTQIEPRALSMCRCGLLFRQ